MVRPSQELLVVTSTAETIRQPSRPAITGGLLVLLAAVGFSAKAVLVKLAYAYSPKLDAITLMSMRMLMSLPIFLLAAVWPHRGAKQAPLTIRELAAVVCLGFLGFYLAGFLDFAGLGYITAGLERLILFLYPTLVVMCSALILSRSITQRERFALLLSYLGIALVVATNGVGHSPQLWLGSALVFGAALSFAFYILASGHFLRRGRIGSRRLTAYVMSSACVATLIHFTLSHKDSALLNLPMPVYGITAVMAIFSTVIPAFLLNAGIQRIGANATAIISSIGPVITLFLAHVLLGENMSAMQLAGTTLIIAGVVIVSMHTADAKEGT
jgi:drug/metabolite transporter (DMT)-like permease